MKEELTGKVNAYNKVLHFTFDEMIKVLTEIIEQKKDVKELQHYIRLVNQIRDQLDKLNFIVEKQL